MILNHVAWFAPARVRGAAGQHGHPRPALCTDSITQCPYGLIVNTLCGGRTYIADRHFVNKSRKWSYLSVLIAGNFFFRSFAHAIRLEIACQQCKCQRFACARLRQKKFLSLPAAIVSWPTGPGHEETHVPWTWTWDQQSPSHRRVMANWRMARGNRRVPCGHVRLEANPRCLCTTHPVTLGNNFFFCHGTNFFFASHPFGQNLPSICMSNPNEMVNFLICLTFSTKNCLSNT